MKSRISLTTSQQGRRPSLLASLAAAVLGTACISGAYAQPAGPFRITGPADTHLVLQSNGTVYAEYYGADNGPLTINGVVFQNNNVRLGTANITTKALPDFGPTTDGTNLALISESDLWSGTGFDFTLTMPAVTGRTYLLELLFHDNFQTAQGSRTFSVNAGVSGSLVNLATDMDLVALGAGMSDNADIVLAYTFTNNDQSPLEIQLTPGINNPMLSAVILQDMSAPPMPPLVTIPPASLTNYVGRTSIFKCTAVGPNLTYQWKFAPATTGVYASLADGNGISGSKTATLTISNTKMAQAGNYAVVVSNASGSATSDPAATLSVLDIPGLSVITGPTDPNLVLKGNFVLAEYYGTDNGPLSIGGLVFYNNNARLAGGTISTQPQYLPNFGTTSDATNLALISDSDLWSSAGLDLQVPTVAGRSYILQLIFHENYVAAAGNRVFDVYAGLQANGVQIWAQNLDLTALGAGRTNNADVVLTYKVNNSDGSPLEVMMLPSVVQNPILSAMTLRDVSPAPVPPLLSISPASQTVFAGRTVNLSAVVSGTPLTYQWQAGTVGAGVFTNVTDAGNISGAHTATLTISNIATANTADYQLIAYNSAGSVTSTPPATVTVLATTPITPDNKYAYSVLTNNPADYWRFSETYGYTLLHDEGSGAHDATPGYAYLDNSGPQSPAYPGFEPQNGAMVTSKGSYPVVTAPPLNLNTNTVTILTWMNPSGNQAPGTGIFLSRSGNISNLCSGISFDTVQYPNGDYSLNYIWNGDFWQVPQYDSGLQVPHDMWSMVGLVITPTNATIYVINTNGMKSWSHTNTHTVCPFTNPTLIGTDSFDTKGARTFNGVIDEVSIFARAMSESEILDLFCKGSGVTALPPAVTSPPGVSIQPQGTTATLACTASGSPVPTCQWMARGIGQTGEYTNLVDGGKIFGSQTATLIISNISLADAGDYILVASNSLGTATSTPGRILIPQTLPPTLLGHWLSGDPDMADKVGFDGFGVHDGAVWGSGSPGWDSDVPPGFTGYSLHLDGASAMMINNTAKGDADYRLTFDNNISQTFSVAFWAKGFPPHGWHPLITKGGENSIGWQVRSDANGNGGNPTFTIRGPGNDDAGNGAPLNLVDGGWHHFVATYDGVIGLRRLYVDGLMEINLNNNRGTINTANINHLVLGAIQDQTFAANWFTGNLFDVRMYSYAISLAEVQALVHPVASDSVGLFFSTSGNVPLGHKETFTVIIPPGANATSPIQVWVTNNSPSVAVIEGATGPVFPVTFAIGAPTSQSFILDVIGVGEISLTVGTDSGLNSTTTSATVAPTLIGRWLNGTADLTDKSGFTPAGTHDGLASTGTALGNATAVFTNDVPTGFSGQSLALDGTYMIAIKNSSTIDADYQPTFDANIADAFTVSFWAKGMPNGWGTWVGKRGEDVAGWKIRNHGGDNAPCFTMRDTPGPDDNFNSATRLYEGTNWHHYVATWDSVTGRKLYVDGKLDFIVPNDPGPLPPPMRNYLTIGGADNNNNTATPAFNTGMFACKIFDVRMFNYAVPGSEVTNLMNPTNTAIAMAADSTIIDLGHTGKVSLSLPAGANATQPVTVWVTNLTPTVVSVADSTEAVFPVTFDAGAYASKELALTGLAEGQAQIAVGAAGFDGASKTLQVYGHHLVGQWFAGKQSLEDVSGFTAAGTHDGRAVGSTTANLGYSTDVPSKFSGVSLDLTNVNNATQVAVLITNTASSDSAYAPTFDEVINNNFTIAFWSKLTAPYAQQWVPFVTKRGEDGMGFQVRRHGTDRQETFTLRGTSLLGGNDDPTGSIVITNTGEWHHIAAVWDGYTGTRKVYVDGELDANIDLTNDFGPFMMGKGHHLVIGSRENNTVIGPGGVAGLDGNSGFNGRLYDVRVYNYPLSKKEIELLTGSDELPQLQIVAQPDGTVQISWPASVTGYILQSSSTVTGGWANSGLTVVTTETRNVVSDTPGNAAKFYRLRLP